MNRFVSFIIAGLMVAPLALPAQSAPSVKTGTGSAKAFSQLAFGAGISTLGVQLQAASNLNPHFGVRGTGNFFNWSESDDSLLPTIALYRSKSCITGKTNVTFERSVFRDYF